MLFDLDGTLVHSAPDIAYAANLTLRDLGLAQQSYERIAGWIGDGMPRLMKRALTGEVDGEPGTKLLERGIQRFKAHYAANLTRETECYPGVVVALHKLKSRGFSLGCVTNKAEAFAQPLLERFDLMKYLSVVVAGDTVAARKPDPLPLRYACEKAGTNPAESVLIGDSANDVLGARAAGMKCIAVTYGYNQGLDMRALEPDFVVDSAVEVPQYLRLHSIE